MTNPDHAWGWSGNIHRAICEIVWQELNREEQKWLQNLISNHKYPSFTTGCSWPDWVRDDQGYGHTRRWHYQDYSSQRDPEDHAMTARLSADCHQGCLLFALEQNRQILLGKQQGKRDEALYFLAHLIADLHQPLHVGREEDAGGNFLQVRYKGREISLHELWDSKLFARQKNALVGIIREAMTDLPDKQTSYDPEGWLRESRRIVHERIYPRNDASPKIDSDYVAEFRVQGYQQMAKAAQRTLVTLQQIAREFHE